MNMLKATKNAHVPANRRSELKEAVANLENEKLFHGAIYRTDENIVIFGAEEGAKLYGPALLSKVQRPTFVVVVLKSDSVYIFAKIQGNFSDEFEFGVDSSDDSTDVQRLIAFCALHQNELHDAPWYCNVAIKPKGAESVVVADKLQLPLDPAKQEDFSEIRQIKPILAVEIEKELNRTSKKTNPLAITGLAAALAAAVFFYIQPEIPEKTDVKSANKTQKVSPYAGLKDFYVKRSAAPKPILRDIYRQANAAKLLRGWSLTEIKVVKNKKGIIEQYFVLDSVYGEVSELAKFAQDNQYEMNVSGRTAYLAKNVIKKELYSDFARFHVGTWHNWLSQGLDDLWIDVDYGISKKEQIGNDHWFISQSEITFPEIFTDDLESIGSLMKGFPYSFDYLEMKLRDRHAKTWEATLKIEIAGVENNA